MQNTRGYAALSITILIWGTTFIVTKLALREIGPLQLTGLRFLIAFALLAPLAARQGFRLRQIFEWKYMLFGLTGTTLYYALQNVGMTFIPVSTTVLILASVPGLTTLLAVIFLKERIRARQMAGIGLVTVGVVLVSLEGFANPGAVGGKAWLGNLLIMASALAWAVYTIQGRAMAGDTPASVMTAASTGAGALLLLPLIGWEVAAQGLPASLSAGSWLGILYMGAAGSGLTMYLWNYALHHLPASTAAAFINLVPVIGVATSFLLGERPALMQLAGGGLAIAGVLLSSGMGENHLPQER